ncbi:MAG: hypothetical protein ABIS21_01070 [Acidimicrobiales bacterium]
MSLPHGPPDETSEGGVSIEQVRGIVINLLEKGGTMPTQLETTAMIQAKLFDSMKAGQKAVLDSFSAWSETVEFVASKLPDLAFAEPMKDRTKFYDTTMGFTEKVIASQRDFAGKLLEASMPATKAATSATQATKAAAAKV